jgi:hypothetical protein
MGTLSALSLKQFPENNIPIFMSEKIICVEITGEGIYHNCLNWDGFSGKPYRFFRNYGTGSYVRAYRKLEDYLAERDDMHITHGVWALKFNLIDPGLISKECYTTPEPATKAEPEPLIEEESTEEETPTTRRPGRPKKQP